MPRAAVRKCAIDSLYGGSLCRWKGANAVNTIWRIDVNLVSMVLLGLVLHQAYARLDHEDAFNRLFFKGCLLILALTAFEAVTCFVNGQPSPWLRGLSVLMHVCLFASPPLMTYYWYLFANTLTMHGNAREMKVSWPYLIPVAANFLLAALSPLLRLSFIIDGAGVYRRGPLFFVTSVISFAYLILGLALLIGRRKNLLRHEFRFLVIFCLLPVVGGVIQGLVYGLLLMWPLCTLALVIMYLYLQERMTQTDSLTAAWTRNSFEYYIAQNLRSNSGRPFGIIYADIDNLKPINDEFGHPEGDNAICGAVRTMKSVLRKGDAIARLGGDEFAIHLSVSTREGLQAVMDRIDAALDQYNRQSGKAYRLSLSLGAELFFENADNDVESIIRRVDHLMYSNKRSKKAQAHTEAM